MDSEISMRWVWRCACSSPIDRQLVGKTLGFSASCILQCNWSHTNWRRLFDHHDAYSIEYSIFFKIYWAPIAPEPMSALLQKVTRCPGREGKSFPFDELYWVQIMSSQGYGLSSSHVQMWELDHKEDWVPKNWCFWTVVLEKTLERLLDCKEIQPVHPEGDQSWIPIGTMDAEAEAPILWPPVVKSQLIRKDPDAGKDWGQKEKGTTEDEMVGWHHQFNEQELGQTLGDGEGQWGLAYSSPWGRKELNTTWQLNRQENWMQTYL